MSTLAEKRKFIYEARHTHNKTNVTLGNIDLNTDQLETKLDSLIVNTNHNEYINSTTATIGAGATTSTSATDLQTSTSIHHLQIVGTTTNTNLDIKLKVSTDNVTYYEMPSISLTTIGTVLSGCGDLNFRYYKIDITNNHGSSVDVTLIDSVKNKN